MTMLEMLAMVKFYFWRVPSSYEMNFKFLVGDGTISQSFLEESGKKRKERSNAKSVECLDMDGNLICVFKSGMEASQVLNISQGDISLCCRGMKRSYMGYKFRFFSDKDEKIDYNRPLKKGYGLELEQASQPRQELMRTTRASRGGIGEANSTAPTGKSSAERGRNYIMEVKNIKVCPFNIAA